MGCIASGRVGLATLESVCLLSYSSFIDGNVHLGQFHLGLALQLCQSARLDHDTAYSDDDPLTERKKRLFWSLQILDHYHGQQPGILSVPSDIWPLEYHLSSDKKHRLDQDVKMPPPFPHDDIGHSQRSEPGIWNTSVYLGSVWSKVRTYVSNCSRGIFKEPWRRDSMYAMVVSDFMEVENRIPMRHRYDSVKFYERKVEELRVNRDYWTPWLKEQFTYHAIPAVLNHPFLYIVGAQHNPNLAIPHTFWRRSSELALIHSTWITRLIDMVMDKQVLLIDPFFGHIAAIAATVHLYYCCAAAPKLKHKSNTDFAKCRRFLKSFLPFSPACAELDRNLDKMAKIAAGSESNDVEDWMPSHIYLSVPLMWKLLQFNCTTDPQDVSAAGLLTASLASTAAAAETDEGVTLDIIVATSPEISVNTADGGQDAPTLPYSAAPVPATPQPSVAAAASRLSSGVQAALGGDITAECPDSLTFNTTPWLYAEGFPSHFDNIGNMDYDMSDSGSNTGGGGDQLAWWQTEFHTGFV
ncbi:hypothetical protein VHEMI09281 [[Torrubiella] hemipterigena]|nr:hypothetical protein VHEMI09281 [[Torrubiella] hemipterigena]